MTMGTVKRINVSVVENAFVFVIIKPLFVNSCFAFSSSTKLLFFFNLELLLYQYFHPCYLPSRQIFAKECCYHVCYFSRHVVKPGTAECRNTKSRIVKPGTLNPHYQFTNLRIIRCNSKTWIVKHGTPNLEKYYWIMWTAPQWKNIYNGVAMWKWQDNTKHFLFLFFSILYFTSILIS